MRKFPLCLILMLIFIQPDHLMAQSLSVNTDGSTADASAMLDVKSSTKGLLIPRVTSAQRAAIASAATGLEVYDTDLGQFYYYNGAAWTAIPFGANASNYWTLSSGNIYNNSGTNVGIGAVAPADKLEVNGNLKFTGASTVYCGTGTTLSIRPGDGSGTGGAITIRGGNAGVGSGGAGGDLNLNAGGNMPIGGSGYGGLGVPGNVNINGSGGYNTVGGAINIIAGQSSYWSTTGNVHADVIIKGGPDLSANDAGNIVIEGGHTFTSGGGGASNATGGNIVISSGLAAGTGSAGNIQLMNGNVGIGTAAPTQKLHVAGNICYTGSIAACSDIRYKTNINPVENSLDKVLQLKPVTYFWKTADYPDMNFSSRLQVGFIAQDLEKLFPEMVFTDIAGYKSIDYSRLTPVLVATIQEQQKQIDAINIRLKQLEMQQGK